MSATNDRQVGGTHYKSRLNHWDIVSACNVRYLEGYASKYMVRWRKQEKAKGLQDLNKVKHIIEKIIELSDTGWPPLLLATAGRANREPSEKRAYGDILLSFFVENDIYDRQDRRIIYILFNWDHEGELHEALGRVQMLIDAFQE